MTVPTPKRGPRKMPSARQIHRWWAANKFHEWWLWFGQVDIGEPSCYRCGWWCSTERQPEGGDEFYGMERAHVIDRQDHGLDGEQNLILLCHHCHAQQPSFAGSDAAFRWVYAGRNWLIEAYAEQQATLP